MQGLMLHCGAHLATIDQVAAVATPTATATHMPVPHIVLVEQVENALMRLGIQVTNTAYALTKHGNRFFGLMDLKSPNNDRCSTLGLRNAHDKSFSIAGVVGSHLFVCDNLAFSGEVQFSRKHTTFAMRDLPQLVDVAIGKLMDYDRDQETRIELYRTTELAEKDADHAFMTALRAQIVPVTSLGKIATEYAKPRHPEFKESGNTVWRLYNAFTEYMKDSLWSLPKRTIALHAILDSLCPKAPITAQYELIAAE